MRPKTMTFNKKTLSERDICIKSITPAITGAGWDLQTQVREEVSLTAGQIIVNGKTIKRGKAKRADFILYFRPNLPIAVVEAKDNNHPVGGGMQQTLGYADDELALALPIAPRSDHFDRHGLTAGPAALNIISPASWSRRNVRSENPPPCLLRRPLFSTSR